MNRKIDNIVHMYIIDDIEIDRYVYHRLLDIPYVYVDRQINILQIQNFVYNRQVDRQMDSNIECRLLVEQVGKQIERQINEQIDK